MRDKGIEERGRLVRIPDWAYEDMFNMTLDEAIEHCKEKVNDSPCGQNHLQLMNWLIELKHLKGEI